MNRADVDELISFLSNKFNKIFCDREFISCVCDDLEAILTNKDQNCVVVFPILGPLYLKAVRYTAKNLDLAVFTIKNKCIAICQKQHLLENKSDLYNKEEKAEPKMQTESEALTSDPYLPDQNQAMALPTHNIPKNDLSETRIRKKRPERQLYVPPAQRKSRLSKETSPPNGNLHGRQNNRHYSEPQIKNLSDTNLRKYSDYNRNIHKNENHSRFAQRYEEGDVTRHHDGETRSDNQYKNWGDPHYMDSDVTRCPDGKTRYYNQYKNWDDHYQEANITRNPDSDIRFDSQNKKGDVHNFPDNGDLIDFSDAESEHLSVQPVNYGQQILGAPLLPSAPPIVHNRPPTMDSSLPIINSSHPIINSSPLIINNSLPIMDNSPPIMDNCPPIMDNCPPIIDNCPQTMGNNHPILSCNPPIQCCGHSIKRENHLKFCGGIHPIQGDNTHLCSYPIQAYCQPILYGDQHPIPYHSVFENYPHIPQNGIYGNNQITVESKNAFTQFGDEKCSNDENSEQTSAKIQTSVNIKPDMLTFETNLPPLERSYQVNKTINSKFDVFRNNLFFESDTYEHNCQFTKYILYCCASQCLWFIPIYKCDLFNSFKKYIISYTYCLNWQPNLNISNDSLKYGCAKYDSLTYPFCEFDGKEFDVCCKENATLSTLKRRQTIYTIYSYRDIEQKACEARVRFSKIDKVVCDPVNVNDVSADDTVIDLAKYKLGHYFLIKVKGDESERFEGFLCDEVHDVLDCYHAKIAIAVNQKSDISVSESELETERPVKEVPNQGQSADDNKQEAGSSGLQQRAFKLPPLGSTFGGSQVNDFLEETVIDLPPVKLTVHQSLVNEPKIVQPSPAEDTEAEAKMGDMDEKLRKIEAQELPESDESVIDFTKAQESVIDRKNHQHLVNDSIKDEQRLVINSLMDQLVIDSTKSQEQSVNGAPKAHKSVYEFERPLLDDIVVKPRKNKAAFVDPTKAQSVIDPERFEFPRSDSIEPIEAKDVEAAASITKAETEKRSVSRLSASPEKSKKKERKKESEQEKEKEITRKVNTNRKINSLNVEIKNDINNWEDLFDDQGHLQDELFTEITHKVGTNVKVVKAAEDYSAYTVQPVHIEELEHVVELFNFPPNFETHDIIQAFSSINSEAMYIKWVDDTHALLVLGSLIQAQRACDLNNPIIQARPMSSASSAALAVAYKSDLKPAMKRPATNLQTARRLITTHLGAKTRISKEQNAKEREDLKVAREQSTPETPPQDDPENHQGLEPPVPTENHQDTEGPPTEPSRKTPLEIPTQNALKASKNITGN